MNYNDIRPHHAAAITEKDGVTTIAVAPEFIQEIGTEAVEVRVSEGDKYKFAVLSWTSLDGSKFEKVFDKGQFRSRNFVDLFTSLAPYRAFEIVILETQTDTN